MFSSLLLTKELPYAIPVVFVLQVVVIIFIMLFMNSVFLSYSFRFHIFPPNCFVSVASGRWSVHVNSTPTYSLNFLSLFRKVLSCLYSLIFYHYLFFRRCPWCNGYRHRMWTRRYEFNSWTRLIAFHIEIILPPAMGK